MAALLETSEGGSNLSLVAAGPEDVAWAAVAAVAGKLKAVAQHYPEAVADLSLAAERLGEVAGVDAAFLAQISMHPFLRGT